MVQPAKRDLDLQSRPAKLVVARLGEAIAAEFLEQKGNRLICTNWRSGRFGEIDLIMQSPEGLILFVEVKTRWYNADYEPDRDAWLSSINHRKRHKIVFAAQSYLIRSRQSSMPARIDAIAVGYTDAREIDGEWRLLGVDVLHVPDAFQPS